VTYNSSAEQSSSADSRTPGLTQMLLVREIQPSLDCQAECHFFSEYVYGSVGTFEYLKRSDIHIMEAKHVRMSLRAVGLASLSKMQHAPSVLGLAMNAYSVAVRLTRQYLGSPTVRDESTLLAALLLDRFEFLYAKREDHDTIGASFPSTVHMVGATQLVKLKGLALLQTPMGTRLFRQMSSQIHVKCAEEGTLIPREITALTSVMSARVGRSERPTWELCRNAALMINLHSAISQGIVTNSGEIVASALDLDSAMTEIFAEIPPNFDFEIVFTEDVTTRLLYEPFYDIYPDFRVALIWNLVRSIRILINETIWKYARQICHGNTDSGKMGVDYAAILERCKENMKRMLSEICATVPQQAGYLAELQGMSPQHSSIQNAANWATPSLSFNISRLTEEKRPKFDFSEQKGAAYSLLWPLYVGGRCPLAAEAGCGHWIVDRLKYISDTFGLSQAATLATYLQQRENPGVWSVYRILGSYTRLPENSDPLITNKLH
jgi:hypothetical protein